MQQAAEVDVAPDVMDDDAVFRRVLPERGDDVEQELAVEIIRRGDVEGARLFLGDEGHLLHEQPLGVVDNALGRTQQAFAMPGEPRTRSGSPVSSRSLRSDAEIDGCG